MNGNFGNKLRGFREKLEELTDRVKIYYRHKNHYIYSKPYKISIIGSLKEVKRYIPFAKKILQRERARVWDLSRKDTSLMETSRRSIIHHNIRIIIQLRPVADYIILQEGYGDTYIFISFADPNSLEIQYTQLYRLVFSTGKVKGIEKLEPVKFNMSPYLIQGYALISVESNPYYNQHIVNLGVLPSNVSPEYKDIKFFHNYLSVTVGDFIFIPTYKGEPLFTKGIETKNLYKWLYHNFARAVRPFNKVIRWQTFLGLLFLGLVTIPRKWFKLNGLFSNPKDIVRLSELYQSYLRIKPLSKVYAIDLDTARLEKIPNPPDGEATLTRSHIFSGTEYKYESSVSGDRSNYTIYSLTQWIPIYKDSASEYSLPSEFVQFAGDDMIYIKPEQNSSAKDSELKNYIWKSSVTYRQTGGCRNPDQSHFEYTILTTRTRKWTAPLIATDITEEYNEHIFWGDEKIDTISSESKSRYLNMPRTSYEDSHHKESDYPYERVEKGEITCFPPGAPKLVSLTLDTPPISKMNAQGDGGYGIIETPIKNVTEYKIFLRAIDYDYDVDDTKTFILFYAYEDFKKTITYTHKFGWYYDIVNELKIVPSTVDNMETKIEDSVKYVMLYRVNRDAPINKINLEFEKVRHVSSHISKDYILYTYVYRQNSEHGRVVGIINRADKRLPVGYHKAFTIRLNNLSDYVSEFDDLYKKLSEKDPINTDILLYELFFYSGAIGLHKM